MARMDFRWILKGQLASASKPGLFGDLGDDLAQLRRLGIRRVVSLTEEPLDQPEQAADGLDIVHFPIDDMSIPGIPETMELCSSIRQSLEREEPVVVHCKAGLGRTGTVLACCLVAMGTSAADAIAKIRLVNRNYIQTQSQERFVAHFEQHLRGAPSVAVGLPPLRLKLPPG